MGKGMEDISKGIKRIYKEKNVDACWGAYEFKF